MDDFFSRWLYFVSWFFLLSYFRSFTLYLVSLFTSLIPFWGLLSGRSPNLLLITSNLVDPSYVLLRFQKTWRVEPVSPRSQTVSVVSDILACESLVRVLGKMYVNQTLLRCSPQRTKIFLLQLYYRLCQMVHLFSWVSTKSRYLLTLYLITINLSFYRSNNTFHCVKSWDSFCFIYTLLPFHSFVIKLIYHTILIPPCYDLLFIVFQIYLRVYLW